jgi:hypothetical protein
VYTCIQTYDHSYSNTHTGYGLRARTLAELRASGSIRTFWQEAFARADLRYVSDGTTLWFYIRLLLRLQQVYFDTGADLRQAVWGVALATKSGILHTSPAMQV